jgi:hypothetical protein
VKRRGRRGRDSAAIRPAPRTEQLLREWVPWLKRKGLSAGEIEGYRSVILDFHRRTGLSDLTSATRDDIERYLNETDREDRERLEDLKRYLERTDVAEIDRKDLEWLLGELERHGEADPDGPEH